MLYIKFCLYQCLFSSRLDVFHFSCHSTCPNLHFAHICSLRKDVFCLSCHSSSLKLFFAKACSLRLHMLHLSSHRMCLKFNFAYTCCLKLYIYRLWYHSTCSKHNFATLCSLRRDSFCIPCYCSRQKPMFNAMLDVFVSHALLGALKQFFSTSAVRNWMCSVSDAILVILGSKFGTSRV